MVWVFSPQVSDDTYVSKPKETTESSLQICCQSILPITPENICAQGWIQSPTPWGEVSILSVCTSHCLEGSSNFQCHRWPKKKSPSLTLPRMLSHPLTPWEVSSPRQAEACSGTFCTLCYHSTEFSVLSSYISLKNDHSFKIWHLFSWYTVMWLNGTRATAHISTGCQHLSIEVLLAPGYHLHCN